MASEKSPALNRRTLLALSSALTGGLALAGQLSASVAAAQAPKAPARSPVRRRFVRVGNRNVHYLRAGTGPTILLPHPLPWSATASRASMEAYADQFTSICIDAPGFGESDPLKDNINVYEIVDAMADTLRALKVPKSPATGGHSGAVQSMELAGRHPDLISGVIIDGTPVFTDEEMQGDEFKGYFIKFDPDPLGGHFSRAWSRLRDEAIWFPWQHKTKEAVRTDTLSRLEPGRIHRSVITLLSNARYYEEAYRSAVFHNKNRQAYKTAEAIKQPALYLEAADDVNKFAERLPPMKPGQEIQKFGANSYAQRAAVTRQWLAKLATAPTPQHKEVFGDGAIIERHFVDLPELQVHVRYRGNRNNPPLVILHDAPGSTRFLAPLIEKLAETCCVYAIDLPGCGASDPLPAAAAIDAYADVVSAVCKEIGLQRINLYGIGIGASVAIETQTRHPDLVRRLALHGVLLPSDQQRAEMRAKYAPPVAISPSGGHLYQMWLQLRDSQVFWPWYNISEEGFRNVDGDFSAEHMSDWTIEVMKQPLAYHQVINAALDHRAGEALKQNRNKAPLLICADKGHPFTRYDAQLAALRPDGQAHNVSADLAVHAARLGRFVRS